MTASMLLAAVLAAATPQTGNPHVDAFVADLAAGRRDAALARIWEMNSLSGRPNAVAFADEFVDKLLRCSAISVEARNLGGPLYDIQWRCPDGNYFSLLDGDFHPPRIVVGEFVAAGEREARRRNPMYPMVAMPAANNPAPSAAQRQQLISDYVAAVRRPGARPPGPPSLLVSFADGRPDAFIGTEQLGAYLNPCSQASMTTNEAGAIVQWACTGPRALAPAMTMRINMSGARITGVFVEVGSRSSRPAARPPR